MNHGLQIEGPALFDSTLIGIQQLGGSSFLTEFGECDEWGMTNADKYFQSWAYWGTIYNDMDATKRITRPYARAIAVYPKSSYNVSVNEYIKWKVDPMNSNVILGSIKIIPTHV
ncbi:hypothetical protein I4U23_003771 [Adineta vaga]|nr:hypothetical protein I4U23_003771 [Adineta vaga]